MIIYGMSLSFLIMLCKINIIIYINKRNPIFKGTSTSIKQRTIKGGVLVSAILSSVQKLFSMVSYEVSARTIEGCPLPSHPCVGVKSSGPSLTSL